MCPECAEWSALGGVVPTNLRGSAGGGYRTIYNRRKEAQGTHHPQFADSGLGVSESPVPFGSSPELLATDVRISFDGGLCSACPSQWKMAEQVSVSERASDIRT